MYHCMSCPISCFNSFNKFNSFSHSQQLICCIEAIFLVQRLWIISTSAANIILCGDLNWEQQTNLLRTKIFKMTTSVTFSFDLKIRKIHAARFTYCITKLVLFHWKDDLLLMSMPRSHAKFGSGIAGPFRASLSYPHVIQCCMLVAQGLEQSLNEQQFVVLSPHVYCIRFSLQMCSISRILLYPRYISVIGIARKVGYLSG